MKPKTKVRERDETLLIQERERGRRCETKDMSERERGDSVDCWRDGEDIPTMGGEREERLSMCKRAREDRPSMPERVREDGPSMHDHRCMREQ